MQRKINIILVVLLVINIIYVVSGVIHHPLVGIDIYSIWLLKTKAFYVFQGFPLDFLKTIGYSHPQYPVLLPFLFSLIYKFVGGVKEYYALIIYPFLYLGVLILAFKFFINMKLTKTRSLLFVYLYSMFSPLLAQAGRGHAGEADIVITFIYWLSVSVIYRYFRKKRSLDLFILSILIGLASQIKLEGVFLAWVFLFLPTEWKKKIYWLVIAVFPSIFWFLMRVKLDIPEDFSYVFPGLVETIKRQLLIFVYIVRQMINIKNWYIFWPLFWLAIFLQKTENKFIKQLLTPLLIVMSLSYFVPYTFRNNISTASYVTSSSDRVMLQLSPFFYIIFVNRVSLMLDKIFR
jgi:hypothetical protein